MLARYPFRIIFKFPFQSQKLSFEVVVADFRDHECGSKADAVNDDGAQYGGMELFREHGFGIAPSSRPDQVVDIESVTVFAKHPQPPVDEIFDRQSSQNAESFRSVQPTRWQPLKDRCY